MDILETPSNIERSDLPGFGRFQNGIMQSLDILDQKVN